MLNKLSRFMRTRMAIVAVSFGLIPFLGGSKKQSFTFNFKHTVNFFQPGEKWPNAKLFTPAEKQVYEQWGRPDYFRLLYDASGELKIRTAIEQEWNGRNQNEMPKFTWVYLQRNEEVVFSGNQVKTQPLNELIHLVIKYGDPESVRHIGDGLIEWTYYSKGKIYRIANNRIISVKEFPAMGTIIR